MIVKTFGNCTLKVSNDWPLKRHLLLTKMSTVIWIRQQKEQLLLVIKTILNHFMNTTKIWKYLFATCTSPIIHLVCPPKLCITFSGITVVPKRNKRQVCLCKIFGRKQGIWRLSLLHYPTWMLTHKKKIRKNISPRAYFRNFTVWLVIWAGSPFLWSCSDLLIALTGKEFFPQGHTVFHLNGFNMKFFQVYMHWGLLNNPAILWPCSQHVYSHQISFYCSFTKFSDKIN